MLFSFCPFHLIEFSLFPSIDSEIIHSNFNLLVIIKLSIFIVELKFKVNIFTSQTIEAFLKLKIFFYYS